MAKDDDRIEKLEERIRKLEVTIAVQGLKVGAITILLVTFFSGIGAILSKNMTFLVKLWQGNQ
jgi:uncharacterized coiled-coil protein SlyX